MPENHVLFGVQGASSHVIGYYIRVSGHMAIRHRFTDGGFESLDVLHGPVYGLAARLTVYSGGKPDHQLAVSKGSDWAHPFEPVSYLG